MILNQKELTQKEREKIEKEYINIRKTMNLAAFLYPQKSSEPQTKR